MVFHASHPRQTGQCPHRICASCPELTIVVGWTKRFHLCCCYCRCCCWCRCSYCRCCCCCCWFTVGVVVAVGGTVTAGVVVAVVGASTVGVVVSVVDANTVGVLVADVIVAVQCCCCS